MKVLVIGDSCLDVFVYGNVDRICPEAPVPVINPVDVKENDGMALNVVNNLRSLGVETDSITNSTLIEKVRYIDDKTNQMLLRMDTYDRCDRCNLTGIRWDEYNAVVISDYNKGFLEEEDIEIICRSHSTVFMDTKKRLGDWAKDANYIKLNQYEYKDSKPYIESSTDLEDKLIVTYGDKGCYYKGKYYPPENMVEVKDACGAGDTFLSAFAVHMVKYNNIEGAIAFAQQCAGDVVSKRGVVVTKLQEQSSLFDKGIL